MITVSPTLSAVDLTARPAVRAAPPPATEGSWRYDSRRRSRPIVYAGMAVSLGVHLAIFFGIGRSTPRPVAPPAEEFLIALTPLPQLKELEEPEPPPTEGSDNQPPDLSLPVPMQADVPQLASPTDFVQQINFASLLEQPDFSQMKVYVIPENIRTGTGKIAEKIGTIFNLADLDRIPEAILQAPPAYPVAMRRESITATVRVEFIVDVDGRVVNPSVVHATASGFEDAALAGVSKWRFRPGWKGGRKVNTRMAVPIVFTLTD